MFPVTIRAAVLGLLEQLTAERRTRTAREVGVNWSSSRLLAARAVATNCSSSCLSTAVETRVMDSDEEALLLLKPRRRRQRQKRKFWVHPILELREQHGQFYHLFMELRSDEEKFFNYFRMSVSSFDELNNILKSKIKREDTIMRRSIQPEERLAVTLRFEKYITII